MVREPAEGAVRHGDPRSPWYNAPAASPESRRANPRPGEIVQFPRGSGAVAREVSFR